MLNHYYLSISDIVILLETDHPLVENDEFAPFIVEKTTADIHASFQRRKQQSEVPDNVIFADQCYRIAVNEKGNIQKFFFENPQDPCCYAVSTCDLANGRIIVEYLESYDRCVSELKNCFFHLGFESILLHKDKLCLHAACIDTHLGGILFSGISGIGKSTQAELWCRYRGARQINGDRPILSKECQGWMAWGSPYAGSSKCHVNENCTISAIVLLKKNNFCSLRRLAAAEAFLGVWAGLTIHSWDESFVDHASLLTIDIVSKIPVFEFGCTADEQAVDYLEQALRKELNL